MIIWLASYPKSGNTWVRSIVSALVYTDDGIFDFAKLSHIKQFPRKIHFDEFTDEKDNFNEIKKYWIPAQEKLNLDNKVKIFKTHHANIKIENYAFTNKENTLGTIYVVRDPRNVVNSLSNHYGLSLNKAKEFMLRPSVIRETHVQDKGTLSPLGTWADNYISWTHHNSNLLLIKYEDLMTNAKDEITKIINFLKPHIKFNFDEKKINNIIESTKFDNLKKMEKDGKFNEYKDVEEESKFNFFNLGPKNKWQNNLDINIKDEIEKKFSDLMKKLGYL